jgi:sugar/nucleoside kinase (ribokinase family)
VSSPELVLIGNLLVDDLVYDDGTTRMGQAGGALLHAAIAATAFGARVGCVSIVGADYPARALSELEARGVSLEGVARLQGPGVRVWLLYEAGARRMIPWLGRPTHADVSPLPESFPRAYDGAKGVHVAPMPWERQAAVAAAVGGGGRLVSLDPCEPLDDAGLDRVRAALAHVDVLFVSDDEVAFSEPSRALSSLAVGRTRFVVHRRGREGGVVYAADGTRMTWSAYPTTEVDPTGAGDVFAAAFMAAWVRGASLRDAVARGAAAASVAVEGVGASALLGAEEADLVRRAAGVVVSGPPASASEAARAAW